MGCYRYQTDGIYIVSPRVVSLTIHSLKSQQQLIVYLACSGCLKAEQELSMTRLQLLKLQATVLLHMNE